MSNKKNRMKGLRTEIYFNPAISGKNRITAKVWQVQIKSSYGKSFNGNDVLAPVRLIIHKILN
jgi:hypothetical protein